MKAIIFGASGGLATALGHRLLGRGWEVDFVTRASRCSVVEQEFAEAFASDRARLLMTPSRYAHVEVSQKYDSYFFTQAIFAPTPLAEATEEGIRTEINVGLTDLILLTRDILGRFPAAPGMRTNFCFIGSTSSYAGFSNTSVYCAVKHGLLGFVRAMNDEYIRTDVRFWLFSMGTMDTDMGAKIVGQDPTTYLAPDDVAARIEAAVSSPSNLFEPEVIMRRRTIRLRET